MRFCSIQRFLSGAFLLPICLLQVECPDELYDALVQTWDQNPQYVDVCDIIINDGGDEEEDDDDGDDDDDDTQDPTLLHTFYRCVLYIVVVHGTALLRVARGGSR